MLFSGERGQITKSNNNLHLARHELSDELRQPIRLPPSSAFFELQVFVRHVAVPFEAPHEWRFEWAGAEPPRVEQTHPMNSAGCLSEHAQRLRQYGDTKSGYEIT